MRPFRRFAALAVLLLAAAPALADIALPANRRPRPNNEVRRDLPYSRMTIERVEGLREARLQIPRSQLEQFGAAAGLGAGGARPWAPAAAGTVVAGLFISLGLVLTGLLLVRSRRGLRVGRAVGALAVCACGAAVYAAAAYANAAPPPGFRLQDPGTLVKAVSGAPLAGSIRVEVVEGGGEIKLLVPARTARGRGEEE